MPPPASEDDLKRRARRRLIGAVALTLVAVIALPLLVEDEPPPAGRLEVHMPPVAVLPRPVNTPPALAIPPLVEAPDVPSQKTSPMPRAALPVSPSPKPKPKFLSAQEPTVKVHAPSKPMPAIVPHQDPTASVFVVQLGAFSDASKAAALKARAAELGLPIYTDRAGALTRLRAGPFPSRDAATAAAVELAGAGLGGQVMVK